MEKTLFRIIKTSIIFLIFFTVLTGLIYPLVVTGIARVFFPFQANGSILKPSGSALIGQPFTDDKYFWSRPSATLPFPYNAAASSGSNLGGANPALVQAVKERVALLKKSNSSDARPVPVDLVTASGSGLDPHISPAAALYQVPRIANARNIDCTKIEQLVISFTEKRFLAILGEPRVNVLKLNMALDEFGGGKETS